MNIYDTVYVSCQSWSSLVQINIISVELTSSGSDVAEILDRFHIFKRIRLGTVLRKSTTNWKLWREDSFIYDLVY